MSEVAKELQERDSVGRKLQVSPGDRVKLEIRGGKMENRAMLFLPALLLLSGVLCGASTVVPTYEHRDPFTGETLHCEKCPPGTHMVAHCTATRQTQCALCREEQFTELWNYLPRCLHCSNLCSENQEVEKECSPDSNRVCRCKEGFYFSDDFCVPHKDCEPGQGVQTKGTLQEDTVCEDCLDGYFSNSSSASDVCVKHQECSSAQLMLLHGSGYQDTVCGSCEDLANGGETLRTFASAFFSTHKMRVGKMHKFVEMFIHELGEERPTTLPKQRDRLLHQIMTWLAQAPEEELRNLPQKLKASELKVMADKLEKRLSEIKQGSPNCTLSI